MSLVEPMSLPLPTPPDDNRFRLLLVEDDEAAARLLLGFLERTGFECYYAGDAETGMVAFKESHPHLVLTESASAQIDGQAFCRWMREQSGIPILMLGPGDESTEVAAFKLGADDYLSHPLRPAVLMARVVSSLRRAYRYNAPASSSAPTKPENPFGLDLDEDEEIAAGVLPPGWARCDLCGYEAPRVKFEKKNVFDEIKIRCPNCKSNEQIVFSLD